MCNRAIICLDVGLIEVSSDRGSAEDDLCVCVRTSSVSAWDNVVRQKCIVGSMSTPHPKLFILSAGLSTIAVETADQELYPHPHGFTSSSPPRPSLPPLSLSHYLSPDSFIYNLSRPHSHFQSSLLLLSFHPSFFYSHYSVYLSSSLVLNSH